MSTQAEALLLINAFEKWSGTSDWVKVKQSDLVSGMKDRIVNPQNIDTSSVNLCGPAAFFYALAGDDPAMYVKLIIDLYKTNTGQLGSRNVTASKGIRTTDVPSGTAPVDWVALGGLRDDENSFLSFSDGAIGLDGATLPSAVEKWFKQAGYTDLKNVTNLVATKGIADLKKADDLRALDFRVCLFINSMMLKSATQTHRSVFPNHWVVLSSPIKFSGANVSTSVWCWADYQQVPKTGTTLATSDLLKNFYGYVAAKPA